MSYLIEKEMKKRDEIINTFDKNYLLEAGAGAGKTSIIVERVIRHMISGSLDPQNMVAITFTKAASLELAERIERKALDYLSKEEYSHAKERLERVEEIFTGTIHSFCELLLREMPFEAGLTPGYEIVEDSGEFYEKIWYEFLREFEEENKDSIRSLKEFNIDYRSLKESAFVAMDNPDIDFIGFEDEIDYEELEEKFNKIDTSYLNPSFIKTGSNFGKLSISIIEDKKDLKNYIDLLLAEACKIDEGEDLRTKFIYKKNQESEGTEELLAFIEELLSIYRGLNSILYNLSTDFINLAVAYKKKRYTNSLTFNDLLFRASRLIKNSPKAREHFRGKFKSFYIDEAQDTDPMQAELLLLLSHDGDIASLKSMEDVKPRAGSLFIVGDPKQSIYRFRRADITIYESVKRIIQAHGEVVYLDINFRSTDEICDWVEENFKDRSDGFAFSQHATRIQAGFEKILSLWKAKEKEGLENKLSGAYAYEFSGDRDLKEEDYVAALVDEMLKINLIEEKTGRDSRETRKIKNKDIMILTKSNEETGRYLNSLKKRDIPALLAGEKSLGDTREVLNLYLLIDFIIDFKDKIKFVAMLRNSFYLDFESINYLLQRGRPEDLIFDEEKSKKLEHGHLREVLFHLREIFLACEDLKAISFIESLVKNRVGVYDSYKDYSQLEKRDADSSLFQTIEILKAKKPISIYDAKEELEDIVEEKVNYELPIDLKFAENAVRVMNIHKAKGLEADIVILVGSDKKRTLGGDSHYIEKTSKASKGYLVYKKSLLVRAPDQEKRKALEREFKEAELDRLIYVAATRAKSVLIRPSIEDEKLFLAPLSRKPKAILGLEDIEDKKIDKEYSLRKLEELEITRELIKKDKISRKSYLKLSPSNLEEFKVDEKNMELARNTTSPRGTIYGSIVHRVFEIILKDRIDIKEIGESQIDYALGLSIKEGLEKIDMDREVLDGLYPMNTFDLEKTQDMEDVILSLKEYLNANLKGLVYSFLKNSQIIDIFSKAKKIFTEFSFAAPIDPSILDAKHRGKKAIINGFIDLLIQKQDGNFIIIDYKTDIVAEEDARELFKSRYIKQLQVYKKVLEEVLRGENIKVDKLLVYSSYLDRLFDLEERNPSR